MKLRGYTCRLGYRVTIVYNKQIDGTIDGVQNSVELGPNLWLHKNVTCTRHLRLIDTYIMKMKAKATSSRHFFFQSNSKMV